MKRNVDVVIDAASWQPQAVPSAVSAMGGLWSADVLLALIHTALWTRPPTSQGFHLSDFWAWLRYHPAISHTEDLRLCAAWESVDPHQKTVLSDELGIGFTTSLLAEKLGRREFIDAVYMVNILEPGTFSLKTSAKTGPKKSPDYIGRLSSDDYCVLECKGTQTSRKVLANAIERGKSQKENIRTRRRRGGQSRIRYSVVAGLFIPQSSNSEDACVLIADPTWDELEKVLVSRTPQQIDACIVQLALAKSLSLAGLPEPADVLADIPVDHAGALPVAARAALAHRPAGPDGLTDVFDTADLRPRSDASLSTPTGSRFSASAPTHLLQALHDGNDIADVVSALAIRSKKIGWKTTTEEHAAEVHTPLGFRFRLEIH